MQNLHFEVLRKKSSTLPRVVWAEESKNDLRFEIGPSYDVVPTRSQLVTNGQSSCISSGLEELLGCWHDTVDQAWMEIGFDSPFWRREVATRN